MLNALCKDFTRQMLIFRYFSDIAVPVITDYYADTDTDA